MSMGTHRRALLSVADKRGLVSFAKDLVRLGFELVSTGQTAKCLTEAGLPVTLVESLTNDANAFGGKLKTMHPKIHAGIVAQPGHQDDDAHLRAVGGDRFDIVVVNLYPFDQVVQRTGQTFEDIIYYIDVGGQALLRSAAKHHQDVIPVVDPADYGPLIAWIEHPQDIPYAIRLQLAKKVFAHTAQYEAQLSNYLSSLDRDLRPTRLPDVLTRQWEKVENLRYGENPHQEAAFYREARVNPGLLAGFTQYQGKPLSYNNLLDAEVAWEAVRDLGPPSCVIVKHANPCGAAMAEDALNAYKRAYDTDPMSAFGGVIALNTEVDVVCAEALMQQYAEVIVAPSFTEAARDFLAQKETIRLLKITQGSARNDITMNRIGGGLLVQTPDLACLGEKSFDVVSAKAASYGDEMDMLLAYRLAKFAKSNAAVMVKDGVAVAIAAGQSSRMDAIEVAHLKATMRGHDLEGAVAAVDGALLTVNELEQLHRYGIRGLMQPGGSARDEDVIRCANDLDMVLVMGGKRHFRH